MNYEFEREIGFINSLRYADDTTLMAESEEELKSLLMKGDPMNCSTPGLPVHHQLLEFIQTHVH